MDRLSNEYNEAIIKKEETENQIKTTEQAIKDIESDLQRSQHQLKKQAISKYKHKDISVIDVLLDSKDFYEFSVNLDFHNRLIAQSDKIVQENKELKDQLATQKEELEAQHAALEQEVRDIESAQEEANNIIADLQAKYDSLDADMARILIQQQMAAASISPTNENGETSVIVQNPTSVLSTGTVAAEMANNIEFTTYVTQAIAAQTGTSVESMTVEEAIASVPASDLNDIVARAYSMMGSPYSWGGTTSAGFDCSGFVSYCLTGQEGTRLGTTGTFIG